MCRHLAWVGEPRSLHELVVAAEHGLYTQSWAPRRQRHGTVNVDGFGVGWYVPQRRQPVRYRRAQPIWTDASFASLAPTISAGCLVAAVRSATPGTAPDESAAAPFSHDRWLMSHNGRIADWPRARRALASAVADVAEARADVDSALLFGLAVACWQEGRDLAEGLAEATRSVLAHGGGRLTMVAGDGESVAAVVCGEPMWARQDSAGTVIASEPDGGGDATGVAAWREIPDRTVVRASPGELRVEAL